MPTIVIDGLTIRLASELQNTFNPRHAFGRVERGGSLALREAPSGHLLLPFDAEGNVLVTPGLRYQLVLVTERKSAAELTDKSLLQERQQQRHDPKQPHKDVQAAAVTAMEPTAVKPTAAANGNHAEGKEKAEEAVKEPNIGQEQKRRGRKNRHKTPASTEELSDAPQQKRERKETPRNDPSETDDGVPLYLTVGSKQPSGAGATDAPSALAARSGSPASSHAVVDKSPKNRAATLGGPSTSDSDDDENVPLSKSYAKQQKRHEQRAVAPTVAAVSATSAEKPPIRRQAKPPRRAPVATPSTSESD
ncbi:uncharacterized protein Tco025E_04364 [Trypanosoma conorhini]|uniref:Uncharacterized protein n=1 Tax=Trypanosoma conorhini TaxID=83891 RepID=A0A3R7NAR0_9TRYP|nr:uncharacterized protein Tco025E_04364 [Trypanosoma conorhini]RNF19185.1 hypothetical protein Tco025E_04364 [Trypanosoma conorhini]